MKVCVYVSAVILAGVLIGFWQYGIDLSSVFLGTPWHSRLPDGRGEQALVGIIVFITLVFGGLFVGGLMALIFNNGKKETKTKHQTETK